MPKTTLLRKQVTPTGTIQPHAGSTAPEGFLVCDGSIVTIADYPNLYAAIGTSWGYGNNDGLTFHLPDLRGRFLRGTDNPSGIPGEEAGRDPDRLSRTASNAGGNTGDAVGSVQGDAYRSHAHTSQNAASKNGNPDGATDSGPNNVGGGRSYWRSGTIWSNTTSSGNSETRPINANVNYIIKAV